MLPFHQYADLFPLIEGEHFDALVADVKANDVREKIVVWDGAILDGRNRYRAALAAGLLDDDDGPERAKYFSRFVPSVDGDPLTYVISKNLNRRHLDESQRAMVAARLATMRQGERTDRQTEPSANLPKVDQPTAANSLQVSARSLRAAKTVQDHGVPELAAAVDRGKLAVSVAEKAARLAPDLQRQVAAAASTGNESAARAVVKREAREAKERDLATKTQALPAQKFNVIYADPPWRFEVYSRETGMDRAADNHYPTVDTQGICDMKVADIAADDCVLFLWATVPMLPEALQVMAAWGFKYKSHQIWNKDALGTGYWFRNKHELLLVGTKGDIPAPIAGTQMASVIDAPVRDHSRKPVIFRTEIEALFPNLPKIELFARTPAPSWHQWGKEAPEALPADDENDATTTKAERRDASLMRAYMDDDNDGVRNAPEGGISVLPGDGDDLDINTFGGGFLRRTA